MKKEQEEVKKRGIIAIGQEKDLKNMNKELEECREQLRVSKEKIDCLNVRVTELDKMVSEKDNKIDDLQQRIKTNENIKYSFAKACGVFYKGLIHFFGGRNNDDYNYVNVLCVDTFN